MYSLTGPEIAAIIRAYKNNKTLESISSVLNKDIDTVRGVIAQYYAVYAIVQDMVG